jgi:hypothetical protein
MITEQPSASHFREFAASLNYKQEELIVVLRAYFDESGEHREDGSLTRLTIGGLVAPVSVWEAFEEDWRSALDRNFLREFHTRIASDEVIAEFAGIITRRIGSALGFIQTASGSAKGTYEISFID